MPINEWIQKILDNKYKSNKVANADDLICEENVLNNSRVNSRNNNYAIYQRNEEGNTALNSRI